MGIYTRGDPGDAGFRGEGRTEDRRIVDHQSRQPDREHNHAGAPGGIGTGCARSGSSVRAVRLDVSLRHRRTTDESQYVPQDVLGGRAAAIDIPRRDYEVAGWVEYSELASHCVEGSDRVRASTRVAWGYSELSLA